MRNDYVARSESGGWSKSGDLQTFDKLGEASMQCNFPIAGYYTVQFGISPPDGIITNPDVTADVTWSVEGNYVRRRLSVGNGVSISGTGQAVSVKARDTTLLGPSGIKYGIFILVSPGTRPSRMNPPFLRAIVNPAGPVPYLVTIPAAGTVTVPIPNEAGASSVNVEVNTSAPFDPTQATVVQKGAGIFLVYKAYMPLVETGFVPLFPSATQIEIINNGATPIEVCVMFGIDG